jgi:protein O-mannosyl-transferase
MSTCESTGKDDERRILGLSVLLAVVTLAVFWPARGFDFVNFDDADYVTDNPHVQAGLTLEGVKWAFTSGHASNWHPLTWLSHMLDVNLSGMGAAGPHFMNILLHSANTSLLFLLLGRMTGAQWRSAFVAALFALHPLHVESAAWISERKDVLSTFYGLLALIFYSRYAEQSRVQSPKTKVSYGLTFLFFALGLMSKPMLVTLPFVMLLLDYWPLGRFTIYDLRFTIDRLAVEKFPFFALSVASCGATMMAQRGAVQPLAHISLGIRAVNAVVSYTSYLGKMFWPVNLAIPYPHPGYGNFWLFCLSAVLTLAIAFVLSRFGRRFPFLVTGWLWYFGMLVPVIGLVQVGMQAMADRYTYLPLVGVFIVVAWGAGEVAARWHLPRQALWTGAILILAACAARTRDQLGVWQNGEKLFRHSIAVTDFNDVAYYNLGTDLYGSGRIDEAIESFRMALQIRPSYDDAMNNLAAALARKGQLDEAIVQFRAALRYRPDDAAVHYNIANVLVMQHKPDEAIQEYREAVRLRPDYPEAHNNLANTLVMQGHLDEAMQHYRETLRLNPGHEAARRQLRALEGMPPQ